MAREAKTWGAGRIVFLARLDEIKADMRRGVPLRAIFTQHQAALRIGYPSFCKLAARYAADAKLRPAMPTGPSRPRSAVSSPATAAGSLPIPRSPEPPPQRQELSDAARSGPRRTFSYDPNASPEDFERLVRRRPVD